MSRYIPLTIREKTLERHITQLYDGGKLHFQYADFIAAIEDIVRLDGDVVVARLQRLLKSKYGDILSRPTLVKWIRVYKEEEADKL